MDRALRTGVTPAQVGQTLRFLHGEDKITEFRRGEDLVEVVLDRAPEPERPLAALGETPHPRRARRRWSRSRTRPGRLGHGFAKLNRRNTQRVVEVTADLDAADARLERHRARSSPSCGAGPGSPGYGYT